MSLVLVAVALWLAVINLVTFTLFRIDKERARNGDWRIPESTLLAGALLGGWPGARLGQQRFRHKTRKQPFAGTLAMIGALQFGLLVVGGFLLLATPAQTYVATAFSQALLAETPAPQPNRERIVINRGLN